MLVRQLFDAVSSTYTYLVADRATGEAVYIDTVFEQHLRDKALLEELGLRLIAVLDTHCHADHVTGAWLLQQVTGCRYGVSRRYGEALICADMPLDDGDVVAFGDSALIAWATPGHTDGCITFVAVDHSVAFTGDALLIRGAGRCDFQQGNAHTLYRSIKTRIFSLPDDCIVYPGHDYNGRTASTIGEERAHNPRIGGHADERDFVGFMENLSLPHPKLIDHAVPANLRCGRPEDGRMPVLADWGPVRQTYAGVLEIEPEWVAQNLDRVSVLDVRQPAEQQASGVIPGSRSIPLEQLQGRIEEIPRDRPVVAVCHAGMRSAQAITLLRAAGVSACANLRGGVLLWSDLRLPLERT